MQDIARHLIPQHLMKTTAHVNADFPIFEKNLKWVILIEEAPMPQTNSLLGRMLLPTSLCSSLVLKGNGPC